MSDKIRLIKDIAGIVLLSGFLIAQSFLIIIGISLLFDEINLLAKAFVLWSILGSAGGVYLAGAFIKREYEQ